ncbi:hypothetical protein L2E82_39738 [Cichorium intybus]|uniref:Uncharacterized protein n=1 Tax=Cichorium intybus TaxID=13427 RepID=A0ACB9AII4_CICIN|nr:hypothetical protein L2E82_39738 [Cichorium intybus]
MKKKKLLDSKAKAELLGETSIASTISYLNNGFVYVGSSYGDSQLVKSNLQPDTKGSLEVLKRYVNLGPIVDFCVVDLAWQGQKQVVTCSGANKDCSLRIVTNSFGINEQASVELQGIKGMWSLRSATDDIYDTFLVVSFISETRILAMNLEDELKETEIKGFCSQVETLFCHDAVHNQLVQVTSSSVRLVSSSSGELRNEWHAPNNYSINVATANATQVLLATRGGHLIYLEIGDGVLVEKKHAELKYDISCLDINPIGENPNYSNLAAVGMWTDISVKIFSLPDLNLITKEQLGGEIIPRSVLLCAFEGIPYLLCALGDGHLLNFLLNTSTGELTYRKKVSLGTQPITLRTFSSKSTTRVFAASTRLTAIDSSNKKLLYTYIDQEVSHICPFNSAAFPNRLAVAKEGELTIGTIGNIQKLHIRSIPLREEARHICHQQQSHTFAICTLKHNESSMDDSGMHFIRLLDDQTFDFISTFSLDQFEYSCVILNCSFSDDNNAYYCVGTAYVMPEENKPTQGRILIFMVEDGKLQLVAEKETISPVNALSAFNGKLLAAINKKIQLYKWRLCDDGTRELQSEWGHHGSILGHYVQTCGDFIVVSDLKYSISLLKYQHEEFSIEKWDCHYNLGRMSSVEILDEDFYLGGWEPKTTLTFLRFIKTAKKSPLKCQV